MRFAGSREPGSGSGVLTGHIASRMESSRACAMLSAFGGGAVFFFLWVVSTAAALCFGLGFGAAESVVDCAASCAAITSRKASRFLFTRVDDLETPLVTRYSIVGEVDGELWEWV